MSAFSVLVALVASWAESAVTNISLVPTNVAVALATGGLLYGAHRGLLYHMLKHDLASEEISIIHDGVKWVWWRNPEGFRGHFGTPVGIAHCPTCSTRLNFLYYQLDSVIPADVSQTWDEGEMFCSDCRSGITPKLSRSWGEAKLMAEPILEREVRRTLGGARTKRATNQAASRG